MRRYCMKCGRISEDGNRWCPEEDCPAEEGPTLLDYGDFLGDVKVVRLLRVLRGSTIYEAERNKQKVLLKVAHDSDEAVERLKREGKVLGALRQRPPSGLAKAFTRVRRPTLPMLLPPYAGAASPYGEITFRGERKCYVVFQHAQGTFLSDLLLDNPQPWHEHAAWLVADVIEALRPLVGKRAHLAFCPDMVLVDVDKKGIYRPLALDLGVVIGKTEMDASKANWLQFSSPGYTAPELMSPDRKGPAFSLSADVYSFGMVLYEMLVGRPGFVSKLSRDKEVREAVRQYRGVMTLNRPELPKEASGLVEKAISPSANERYTDLLQFGAALRQVFGHSPAEEVPRPIGQWIVVAVSLLLMVALVVALVALAWAAMQAR